MGHKLIAVAITHEEKDEFKKVLSKLHTSGKIDSTMDSRFLRLAVNEKLSNLGSKFKI